MNEKQFQANVLRAAVQLGWDKTLCYHTLHSFGSTAGFPDLVLVREPQDGRPGRVVYAELKAGKGKVTEAQQHWIDALRANGVEAYVWRAETDWPEAIARVLRA